MNEHDGTPPVESTIPTAERPPLWQRIARAGVTLLVLVLVFGFVLPQLADYRAVADYIQGIEPFEWLLLAVFAGWFLIAYVFVFMATLPSLRFKEGFVVQTTATAINNSLPAGGAIALSVLDAIIFFPSVEVGPGPVAPTTGFDSHLQPDASWLTSAHAGRKLSF